MEIGLIAVGIGLCCAFGVAFDQAVGWIERRGYDEGYTALLVAVGVVVTLVCGWPIVAAMLMWTTDAAAWVQALAALAAYVTAFTASGVWMIGGSVARYAVKRRRGQDTWTEAV